MKKVSLLFFVILFILWSPIRGLAQWHQTGFLLDPSRSAYGLQFNPAWQPAEKVMIGVPALNRISIGYDATVNANDLFIFDGTSVTFELEHLIESGMEDYRGQVNARAGLMNVGFKTGKHFINFGVAARAFGYFSMDGDLLLALAESLELDDGVYEFDDVQFRGLSYVEVALGDAIKINDRWQVGFRAKYLQGIGQIESDNFSGVATVDRSVNRASIQFNQAGVRSAGYDFSEGSQDRFDISDNRGFGADIAVQYNVSDDLQVGTSFVDLGRIHWKSNGLNFTISDNVYETPGTVLEAVTYYKTLEDGIRDVVVSDTTKAKAYWENMPAMNYTYAIYNLTERHQVSALLVNTLFQTDWDIAGTIGYNYYVGKGLTVHANVTSSNEKLAQLGVGFRVQAGPVQLVATVDDLPGIFHYKTAKQQAVGFGLNLLFGKDE